MAVIADTWNETPDWVRSYFGRVVPRATKVLINSGEPSTQEGCFRAIGNVILAEGWSGLEKWGVWSEGHTAVLYLNGRDAGEILIDSWAAISPAHPKLTVLFRLGSFEMSFVFSLQEGTRLALIRLPIPVELRGTSVIRLEIKIDAPRTPYEQTGGESTDHRRIGIGLSSIEFLSSAIAGRHDTSTTSAHAPGSYMTADREHHEAKKQVQGGANVIAVTMVYNEGRALQRWLAHYGRHLGARNLLVIDDGSDDGSTDKIGLAGRLTVPRKLADDGERAEFVSDIQRDLLRYFDAVIYADCDEFLVPDPRRFCSLREYVDNMTTRCVRPVAFNVIHIRDREAALRFEQPILDQRSYCQFYTRECKPLLTKVPVRYVAGFHHCDRKALLDPELLLVHSKLADFSAASERLSLTRTMAWSPRAIQAEWGTHSRATDSVLIGTFEQPERELHAAGVVEPLNPTELAARTNAEIEQKGPTYRCAPFTGPLSMVPDWLRGTV